MRAAEAGLDQSFSRRPPLKSRRANAFLTIVFVDLSGSSTIYEDLGNGKAAQVVSKLTQWIGRVCTAHDGKVIKFLGDGVLASFENSNAAFEASTFLQRNHEARIASWPPAIRMSLKIGIASGQVALVEGDAYGEAVNLASRLSDMAGPGGIWADDRALVELKRPAAGAANSFDPLRLKRRSLGPMRIRGIVQTRSVSLIEWNENVPTSMMTVPASLTPPPEPNRRAQTSIRLSWHDQTQTFTPDQLPIEIGRIPGCAFIVSDQRVSRQHARLHWQDGSFILTDLSSFGCWVRFAGDSGTGLHLRRNHCALQASGEISLSVPPTDSSAPILNFAIQSDPA